MADNLLVFIPRDQIFWKGVYLLACMCVFLSTCLLYVYSCTVYTGMSTVCMCASVHWFRLWPSLFIVTDTWWSLKSVYCVPCVLLVTYIEQVLTDDVRFVHWKCMVWLSETITVLHLHLEMGGQLGGGDYITVTYGFTACFMTIRNHKESLGITDVYNFIIHIEVFTLCFYFR